MWRDLISGALSDGEAVHIVSGVVAVLCVIALVLIIAFGARP